MRRTSPASPRPLLGSGLTSSDSGGTSSHSGLPGGQSAKATGARTRSAAINAATRGIREGFMLPPTFEHEPEWYSSPSGPLD